ncbi:MAG: anti-sigma factor family protein [Anaerolineales bacterium]|jgi:hypothetical protein
MNHRPFEDWLLEDRHLNPQEQRALQAHVRSCRSCAAIAESNLTLHSTRWVPAPSGFAERFTQRLGRWQTRQRWFQVTGTLLLVLSGLSLLYAVALPVFQQALHSPADWLTAAAVYLVFLLESMRILSEVGRILARDLPAVVAPAGWLILAAGASFVAAACGWWARRVATAPQGVRS